MTELTQDIIKELFEYDPETGVFTYKVRDLNQCKSLRSCVSFNNKYAGTIAGCIHEYPGGKKYIQIIACNKRYLAHRLAVLYMKGYFPDKVDHLDGNGTNNKWDNLRETDSSGNNKNQRMRTDNNSGVVGVFWCKTSGKWVSRIYINSEQKTLGYFTNFDKAVEARKQAEIKYGYHCNHGTDRSL